MPRLLRCEAYLIGMWLILDALCILSGDARE
jgi:hypothetical protein